MAHHDAHPGAAYLFAKCVVHTFDNDGCGASVGNAYLSILRDHID